MTLTSFPLSGGSILQLSQAQWAAMMRSYMPSGVVFTGDASWDLNKFATYADSTGMRVKLPSGRAQMLGNHLLSDAEEILTIAAAHATLPRIDRVVLRLDQAANTHLPAVLTGTPATPGTQVPPALTQTPTGIWETPLAQVAVGAAVSTIAAGNVSDERVYVLNRSPALASAVRASTQNLVNATSTAISFSSAPLNMAGMWNAGAPTRLTCLVTGIYVAQAWDAYALNAAGDRLSNISKNGVTVLSYVRGAANAAGETAHSISTVPFLFSAGEYIELLCYQSSGGALNVNAGAALGCYRIGQVGS